MPPPDKTEPAKKSKVMLNIEKAEKAIAHTKTSGAERY